MRRGLNKWSSAGIEIEWNMIFLRKCTEAEISSAQKHGLILESTQNPQNILRISQKTAEFANGITRGS